MPLHQKFKAGSQESTDSTKKAKTISNKGWALLISSAVGFSTGALARALSEVYPLPPEIGSTLPIPVSVAKTTLVASVSALGTYLVGREETLGKNVLATCMIASGTAAVFGFIYAPGLTSGALDLFKTMSLTPAEVPNSTQTGNPAKAGLGGTVAAMTRTVEGMKKGVAHLFSALKHG